MAARPKTQISLKPWTLAVSSCGSLRYDEAKRVVAETNIQFQARPTPPSPAIWPTNVPLRKMRTTRLNRNTSSPARTVPIVPSTRSIKYPVANEGMNMHAMCVWMTTVTSRAEKPSSSMAIGVGVMTRIIMLYATAAVTTLSRTDGLSFRMRHKLRGPSGGDAGVGVEASESSRHVAVDLLDRPTTGPSASSSLPVTSSGSISTTQPASFFSSVSSLLSGLGSCCF
mmetsp:Transcript_23151/g.57270  ORF Transcript_23151/g.57270 Transcript_23151/m.57270 type:complete len:226 (-) Transcript_23151:446-1123(-)